MNGDSERKQRENASDAELRKIDDTYVLDRVSGLYKPQPYASQNQGDQPLPGTLRGRPLFIHANRDRVVIWISIFALLISALTLVFIWRTVYWTREQWVQSKRTADASIGAANASQVSATAANNAVTIAQKNLDASIEDFRIDQRAWIEIEPIKPQIIRPDVKTTFRFPVYPKNVGKTAARDIVVLPNGDTTMIASMEQATTPAWIKYLQDSYLPGGKPTYKNTPRSHFPESNNAIPEVLGPGETSPTPVNFYGGPPAGADDKTGKNPHIFLIFGRISYSDEFSVKHWKRYCFYVANEKGDVASCEIGNDEDHNPEVARSNP